MPPDQTPLRTVAVVMAMLAEAEPVLERLGAREVPLPPEAGPLPFRWFVARVAPEPARPPLDVVIAVNGRDRRTGVDKIGTQPAALNAYVTCLHHRPDLVISAGTAGAWASQGTEVGDVFVSRERFVYHDRRIPLPGFDDYAIGAYPAVDATALVTALGCKSGIVSTGNSLHDSDEDHRMMAEVGASVKEMEAAAVAWVADLLATPMLAVKAVTDLIDHPAGSAAQFTANLSMASARLADALVTTLHWCAGRTIADLGRAG